MLRGRGAPQWSEGAVRRNVKKRVGGCLAVSEGAKIARDKFEQLVKFNLRTYLWDMGARVREASAL